MQKYDGNAALDLNLAPNLPQEKRRREIYERPRPVNKAQKTKQKRDIRRTVRLVALVSAVLMLAAVMVNGRGKLSELNLEILEIENDIKIAKSENTRLSMEYTSTVSIENVEEYVINGLGMQKIDKYQIKYIDISIEDEFLFSNTKETDIPTEDINQRLKEVLKITE